MSLNVYSWHESVWARLASRLESPAHALLVQGRKGVGKLDLALRYARVLLCETQPRAAIGCGRCEACGWFSLGNHPDFRLIIPEADSDTAEEGSTKAASKQIRIDQVRLLQEWLAVPGHRGARRVAVLHPGEAMNPSTQNALLKTLEEPTPGAVLVIVSHRADRLLPTVRSRCQALSVGVPPRDAALAWLAQAAIEGKERLLALSGGAPLAAAERTHYAELAERLARDLGAAQIDPVRVADAYQGTPLADVVDLLQKWLCDALSVRVGGPVRYFAGFESALGQAAAAIRPERATRWWRELAEARGLVDHPLNARLVLESLFAGYGALHAR